MTDDKNITSSWAYSRKLFQNEENKPLEFYVHPSVDSDHIIKLIKSGGGEVVCAGHPRAIHIFSQMGFFKNRVNLSSSFIYGSCLKNELLDVDSFRIQPEKFLAAEVFKSLLKGIEMIFEKMPKERIVNLVRLMSSDQSLWARIAGSKEFEGCSAVEIRNTFNIWAFLNMRGEKWKHDKVLSNLISVVKEVAEEYCGCGKKIEAFEKHLNSTKSKRKSPTSLGKESAERKLIGCGEEEQAEQTSPKSPETVDLSPSDIPATEDAQERVVVKVEDGDADLGHDNVSNVNGVKSRECASVKCMEVEDRVDKEVTAEKCAEERTVEGSEKDLNSAKESDATVDMEENTGNVSRKNKNSKEIEVGSVKSGVWLGKSSMKKMKLSSELREKPEASEDSSSSTSEAEVTILRKLPPNNMYTYEEDLVIIKWVLKTRKCPWKVQGNRIWEYFEKKKILPNRTWQSMKERFKRRICSNLNRYNLSDSDIKKLKRL